MDDNSGWILIIGIAILFISVCFVGVVLSSDIPTWAKWLILMG